MINTFPPAGLHNAAIKKGQSSQPCLCKQHHHLSCASLPVATVNQQLYHINHIPSTRNKPNPLTRASLRQGETSDRISLPSFDLSSAGVRICDRFGKYQVSAWDLSPTPRTCLSLLHTIPGCQKNEKKKELLVLNLENNKQQQTEYRCIILRLPSLHRFVQANATSYFPPILINRNYYHSRTKIGQKLSSKLILGVIKTNLPTHKHVT